MSTSFMNILLQIRLRESLSISRMMRVPSLFYLTSSFILFWLSFDGWFYTLSLLLFIDNRLFDLFFLLAFVSFHDCYLHFLTVFGLVVYLWTTAWYFFIMSASKSW